MMASGAGIDAIVAEGWEAGGHRCVFDPGAPDDQLGTMALTCLLVCETGLPVLAVGGIIDGAGIAAVLELGAAAAQLGMAFVATDESLADAGYRAALMSDAAHHTVMTRAISGRPARSLANRFTALGMEVAARPCCATHSMEPQGPDHCNLKMSSSILPVNLKGTS
jgi:nitronate monooxygenase